MPRVRISLERRLQTLVDEIHERLVAVALERGVSVATVVREGIDRGLASPSDAAGCRILDAAEMPAPSRRSFERQDARATHRADPDGPRAGLAMFERKERLARSRGNQAETLGSADGAVADAPELPHLVPSTAASRLLLNR
jgi:hypothetical protein